LANKVQTNLVDAAAQWLAQNATDQGSVYRQQSQLVRELAASTGISSDRIESEIGQHWQSIMQSWQQLRSSNASRTDQRQATGGAGAQLSANEFLAQQIPGVRFRTDIDFSGVPETVLARSEAKDKKGRTYGTPRNPGVAPLEKFNPKVAQIRAGLLEQLIKDRKHGIDERQAKSIAQLSNDDLTRYREDEPISALFKDGGLSLTGGHHRTNEIIQRVRSGKMSPDALVEVMIHE
jgi:hypothetical protein